MPKNQFEIEQPYKIVDVVKKVIDFNQNQAGSDFKVLSKDV